MASWRSGTAGSREDAPQVSPYVISARQRRRWPRANPSLSSLGSRLVVLAAARRLRSFDAAQDRSPGGWRGSFLLAYRSTVSPQRRAVAAWQKKKACSRELHAFRVTPVVPSARTVPDLCFVCDDYACVHTSRHVTLSAGDPLLATTTTNSGSFSETKTSLYSFLSWITRNKLPRCVPKKNKTQREEYSSSGD